MSTAAWIRHNMIWEPTNTIEHRKPMEAELRVRRSLQQLQVPDWYLNKCRASPKIINDRRPIETRPAPWKDAHGKRFLKIEPSRAANNLSGDLKRPFKAEVRKEETLRITAPKPPNHLRNAAPNNIVAKVKSNISKTFPKISPSRKIQNINIVFPSKQEEPESPKTVIEAEQSSSQSQETVAANSNNVKTKSTPQRGFKTPRMNCPPPAVPSKSPNASNNSYVWPRKYPDACLAKLFQSGPTNSFHIENASGKQQVRSPGGSLLEEIIQELNSKCDDSSKSFHVSPGSTNFVKKLVQALEKGCAPKYEDEENGNESGSDTDSKSGPSSTSISFKDSDSGSDSEAKSPTSKASTDSHFRSFANDLSKNDKAQRKYSMPYVDEDDDSVYWIPLPSCKLPRTSSLKSMMSRLSFNSCGTSPIASPIEGPSSTVAQLLSPSGWGKTFYRRRPSSRQLFRIDETVKTDSGYSDRSGTNSSSSSSGIDGSWFDDLDTTASEFGYDTESVRTTQTSHPHRLPSYRQRTFVI